MKPPSIILFVLAIQFCADRVDMPGQAKFFTALALKESTNNPAAWNKAEDAVGIYQIRPIYLRDVNKMIGKNEFQLQDRRDVAKSRWMVEIYLDHYATKARLGRVPTICDLARIHNGGPNGWRKQSTKEYANEFMRIYDKETLNHGCGTHAE